MRNERARIGLMIAVGAAAVLMPCAAFLAAAGQAGSGQAAGGTPVTDADVIRMEQAILNAVRSRPVNFDLSPGGIAALRQAGVGEEILNAMEQAERQAQATPPAKGHGQTQYDAVTLQRGVTHDTGFENWANSAQATRPAGSGTVAGPPSQKPTPQQISALLAKLGSAPSRPGSTVNNPAAGQANSATLAILRQQKQTALVERGKASPPGGHPPSPNFARASSARPEFPAAETSPSPTGSSLANRAAIARQPNSVLACATFNTPIIQAVSGQQSGTAVFSQDPEFNPFTIKGCNFGSVAGRAQLNYANGGKLADLRVDSWTDNLITVELSPSLVNVLDQNNVTLMLFPVNKPQAQRSGFKFFAMRRQMRLASIPRNRRTAQVTVTNDDSGQRVIPYFSTPYRGLAFAVAAQTETSVSQVSPNLDQGWTAGVDRINAVRFPAGTDVFRFDGLKPGFVLEKFQIDERNVVVCRAGSMYYLGTALKGGLPFAGVGALTSAASSHGVTNYSDGTWNASIGQNTIRVNWAEGHCHATDGNDSSNSSYALNVWVVGPALAPGTSPWQESGSK